MTVLASSCPDPILRDRRVLVTGGSSGIGFAIAAGLLANGARVVVTGRRPDALEGARQELDSVASQGQVAADPDAEAETDPRCFAVPGDVSSPASSRSTVRRSVELLGGLDHLVNNAGVARGGPIEEMTDDDVDLVVDVDLKGPIHMIRAALPHLADDRSTDRSILNVSSSVTLGPIKDFSVYTASKAGVDSLTRSLALELADHGIRVNALCPGVVRTPILATMMPADRVDDFLERFRDTVPLGRAGEPDDVARLALALLGSPGRYVTGAVIPIDGGLSLAADGKA